MTSLNANKRKLWYANPTGETVPVTDAWGNETGEEEQVYTDPVSIQLNVSAASGAKTAEAFGSFTDYSRTIVTADMACPLKLNSRIWFGTYPPYEHNYVVVRVADCLNGLLYALKEVV